MTLEMTLAPTLARPAYHATKGPRYVVEPTIGRRGLAMYALRDIKTRQVVKFYRSDTVARGDAQFLNRMRPPLPLG